MADRSPLPPDRFALSDTIAVTLRQLLRATRLTAGFRLIRLLIHFGPWRTVAKRLIQAIRPPLTFQAIDSVLLPAINPQRFARSLRSESVVVAGCIKHPLIDRLKNRTRNLPVNHYKLMHHIDEDIRQLSEDSAITSVLRHYLKSEPVLLEATLSVTEGANASSQNTFHFDYAGWESVNVFVYLTNVSRESAHHTVIKGSHLDIRLRDIFRGVLSHGDADIRFGARITPIIGEAGTLFFENTEAFHCRHLAPERRVLLNLLYASHKSCLSRGRTSKQHIKRRAAEYRRFVNSLATRPS